MSNTGNLKPWRPGQSGNPGGRPKKKLIDDALEELLSANDSELAVLIAHKLLAKAKRGELKAIQLIAERVEGKPKAKMEISAALDGNVDVRSMTLEEIDAEIARITGELGYVKKDDRPTTSDNATP